MTARGIVRYGQAADAICQLTERGNHGAQRGWTAILLSGHTGFVLDTEISEASAGDIHVFTTAHPTHAIAAE